ncbi:MAG: hypothetical protein DRR08_03720 [Candidatus Parabeggiatoa sp. nov. 2]|nr:MAG: hypothetical protein B6247_08530 [Beggiatoa sp. 4572_84]RKZ63310.1 MAG: hypothetical protein DRR08_03720 [Gammaproteobacteria bacterium]
MLIFNARKPLDFPWRYEVTKYASQQPFIFLQTAFNRFFQGLGGYPQFKQKGHHDSIGNEKKKLDGKHIKLPKLGWILMFERAFFLEGDKCHHFLCSK